MYERFPGGGIEPEPEQYRRAQAPGPVILAVRLMYAGAVVSAINLVVGIARPGSITAAIQKANPSYTAGQIAASKGAIIAAAVISGLVGVALWLWMAWANGRGRNWARILGTVFFAITTISLPLTLAQPSGTVTKFLGTLTWLIGAVTVFNLWRRESSAYFKPGMPR